ncbi:MAG: XTP/dITP diphosphatase [Proteobacteria bacterium]|nr:XTP/dITP diphosphatase [Pseudomonadota bacterium]MBU1058311.1 XTP/dITP diphosphatase [Pseudomonadota bacterium]
MVTILVLATTNKNKIKEFQEIVKDFPIEIRSVGDFGPLPECIEDGKTFDDNAYKKALHTAKILGLPAIADDSGLEVEALNGAPGVYSARYAGESATDAENCEKLLQEMAGNKNRKAAFKCVLSIAVPSGPALTYEGSCEGVLLNEKRGESGFGYDPLFFFEPLNKTFAECTMEEKNKYSHRGKALADLSSEFDKVLKWLNQRLAEEKPPKPDHSEFEGNDWSK